MNKLNFEKLFYEETNKEYCRYVDAKLFEDENFLNLYTIFEMNKIDWFHNYFPAYSFQDLCKLYDSFHHDIEDDGSVIFLSVEMKGYPNDQMKHIRPDLIETNLDEFTFIYGELDYEIDKNKLKEYFPCFQISYYKDFDIVSHFVSRLDWDGIKFLASLRNDYSELNSIKIEGKDFEERRKNIIEYKTFENTINQKIKNYFRERSQKFKNSLDKFASVEYL